MSKSFKIIVLIAGAFFVVSSAYAALSDTEKAQKREELTQFFAKMPAPTQGVEVTRTKRSFNFTANAATRFGYDSNASLDNNKDGDAFYEEKVGGNLEYAPEGASLWGHDLAFGVDGRYGYLGYSDLDELNRQSIYVSPYIEVELSEVLKLETAYEFKDRIYDSRDDLSNLSHGAEINLTHQITPELSQKGLFRYESVDFSKRKAVLSDASASADERSDDRYVLLYGLKYRSGSWTLRADGSWAWNDSNDEYFDYNDYDDAGVDGSIAYKISDHWIISGHGGWHERMFDERAFGSSFGSTQKDDYFYGGAKLFYTINTWSAIDVTFTYFENASNDSDHDYSTTNTSAGLHVYF